MKFSNVALAASTALSQTFLSNAAALGESTPFLPEASVVAGQRKLQVQGLTCDSGVGHVDCVNGFDADNPGTSCYAACDNGDSCCRGTRACESFTGRVCKDGSCYGMQACHRAKIGLVSDSCKGPLLDGVNEGNHGACYDFGRQSSTNSLSVGLSGSCHGPAACWRTIEYWGQITGNFINSCHGKWSCYGIASRSILDGDIINSCKHPDPNSSSQDSACSTVAAVAGSRVGSIINSCNNVEACAYLGHKGTIPGGVKNACNARMACTRVGSTTGSVISKVWDCCDTPATHWSCNPIGEDCSGSGLTEQEGCYYMDTRAPQPYTDSSLPDACTAGTMDPTASPTTSPTVPGPLTLAYDKVEANFTAGASNEFEVEFVVGVGRTVTVDVFKSCDKEAEEVSPSLFTKDISPESTESNLTHSKISIGYNFNKTQMIDSSLWNSTSETLMFCQVTSVTVPSGDGPDLVILSDHREIKIKFDLDADFEVDVGLAEGTIKNATEAVDFDNQVRAYKCQGGSTNSFFGDDRALPPNTQLAVCITSENDSVNIAKLTDMIIEQDNNSVDVVDGGDVVVQAITDVIPVESVGVLVKTRVPIDRFSFETGKNITIYGEVELELTNGRRLRALEIEDSAASAEPEEAGYAVTVYLKSEVNGIDENQAPIGSSDGYAILGNKGLGVLFSVVLAVMSLVM